MTPTLLDRPVRAHVSAPREPEPGSTGRRRRQPAWLFPAALGASVLVHLAVLLLIRFHGPDLEAVSRALREQRLITPEIGMSVVEVVPAPAQPEAGAVPEPELDRPRAFLPPPTGPAETETARAVPETRGPPASALDRILPGNADPRLWAPRVPPPAGRADPVADALAPLYANLGLFNDSTRAAAEAAARATDWTTTDASGGRWGISPGQIHLGSLTLPLPFGFSPPPGRRDELSGRVRGWSEIQRQSGDVATRESFDERVKAIRERRAADRDTSKVKKD